MVAVCTRGHLHAEMAMKSALEGAPLIFCEKAIACSMLEADALRKAVEENGALFNSGVLRRFDVRYHQARDLIRNGEIGEPPGSCPLCQHQPAARPHPFNRHAQLSARRSRCREYLGRAELYRPSYSRKPAGRRPLRHLPVDLCQWRRRHQCTLWQLGVRGSWRPRQLAYVQQWYRAPTAPVPGQSNPYRRGSPRRAGSRIQRHPILPGGPGPGA